MSHYQAISFNFDENHQLRTVLIKKEPWVCLKDVSNLLGLKNSRMVIERLDPKGVNQADLLTDRGIQSTTFINEPNLYRVIFRSDKPEAQKFQNWVFEEVLPALRKKGYYAMPDLKDRISIQRQTISIIKQLETTKTQKHTDCLQKMLKENMERLGHENP